MAEAGPLHHCVLSFGLLNDGRASSRVMLVQISPITPLRVSVISGKFESFTLVLREGVVGDNVLSESPGLCQECLLCSGSSVPGVWDCEMSSPSCSQHKNPHSGKSQCDCSLPFCPQS